MEQKIKTVNIIVCIIVYTFVIFVTSFLAGCSDSNQSNIDGESGSDTTTADAKGYATNMNEPIEINYISYEVFEAVFTPYIPTTLGTVITTKNIFLIVMINVQNNWFLDYYEYISDFSVLSPTARFYQPTDYIYIYNRLNDQRIAPGFIYEFWIAFELPYIEEGDYYLFINKLENNFSILVTLNNAYVYEE